MKLDFTLMVVDDAVDNVQGAIDILRDHLQEQGFVLNKRVADDLSDEGMRSLAHSEGKDYDLVMVDYNLGQDETNGAVIAKRLRQILPYTEIVFYSSTTVAELLKELATYEVSGVFAERRQDLGDALKGLADTVIGKAVDLNHMRGIVMAGVAEMDLLMEETLAEIFRLSDVECVHAARSRTATKLRRSMQADKERLDRILDENGLVDVIRDARLFSSVQKYRAVSRVAACVSGPLAGELEVLSQYQTEIIQNRNILAHAKESIDENGRTFLRSVGSTSSMITIDESWMIAFRRNLRKHRAALTTVCNHLRMVFAADEVGCESEKS